MTPVLLEYRVYDKVGNVKTPLNGSLVGDFSFGANAGGGYGQLALDLKVAFDSTLYTQGDIIEVIRHVPNNSTLLYAGELGPAIRTLDDSGAKIQIDCFGLFTLLQKVPYANGTISGTASTLLKQVIDYFQTQSPWSINNTTGLGDELIYYTGSSIETTATSINIAAQNDSCWSLLKKIAATDQDKELFVDIDGLVIWKSRPSTPSHIISVGTHTKLFEITETEIENIVDVVAGVYNNRYSNTSSITTYGPRYGGVQSKSELANLAAVDAYGNSYVAKRGEPRKQISATINNSYNIVALKPLQTVWFQNTSLALDNELILGIKYTSKTDEMELVFEDINTLNKVFTS